VEEEKDELVLVDEDLGAAAAGARVASESGIELTFIWPGKSERLISYG
jgi:hypothetical protein